MEAYPSYATVKKASIKKVINNITLRDWLEIDINKNASRILLYVLMNPSKANKVRCDKTVKKVLDFTRSQTSLLDSLVPDVKTVIIVNLFPFYKTDSSKLYELLNELCETRSGYEDLLEANLLKIRRGIQKADYIVYGWGDPPDNVDEWYHRELTSRILITAKRFGKENTFVFKSTRDEIITQKRNPRHPIIITLTGLKRCKMQPFYTVSLN
ncbi:DUF1643 domain-containing protein [Bacillus sp. ISL-46]|uniref:DUF1643 domain-containing protein n=1 Tax=Bacillus sp. ISL-46 TaxID=2819129 RepID=UPI001BEC5980|nr:DUF1643 domain-containing protein [Bacillus sp. ISL-46]MBT2724420.1 DUF1643 domain-containing protein [Bacillus sp. ISL-46]